MPGVLLSIRSMQDMQDSDMSNQGNEKFSEKNFEVIHSNKNDLTCPACGELESELTVNQGVEGLPMPKIHPYM